MKGYEDLVKTLKHIQSSHVMDCTPEAVCEYQDMIGTSTLEQVHDLANGIYKNTFYKVYDLAYGTEATIRFYLDNSDKIARIMIEKAEQEAEIEKLNFLLEEQKKDTEAQKKIKEEAQSEYAKVAQENMKQASEIESLKAEMQALKARLYDLMTA